MQQNDLVFGSNMINISSVLTDWLPTLEAVTNSYMVRVNLNAARKTFIEAERSKKNSESTEMYCKDLCR